MNIENLREKVSRHTDDDGRVIDTAIPDGIPLVGTIGEVISLGPNVEVELLSGRIIKPKAYVGPVPNVGQHILMVRVARFWIAV
ncbi:MAG TPA: hypothetical protein VLA34_13590, partial [Candidatus Krumholzibacterium sp.]|nr:hypothetical protein [Candidatus Krumholzibacterium sp.]